MYLCFSLPSYTIVFMKLSLTLCIIPYILAIGNSRLRTLLSNLFQLTFFSFLANCHEAEVLNDVYIAKKRSAFTSKWCQLSCEHCPTYCCRNLLACLNDKINNIMVIKPLPKKNITLRWRNDGENKTHNHLQQLMQITTNLPQPILLTTCLMICPCSAW